MLEKNKARASSRFQGEEEGMEQQGEVGCYGMSPAKKFFLLFGGVVVVLLIIGFGAVVGVVVHDMKSYSPYSAVYLTSGDIYFGKFRMFPWPSIENPAYLQRIAGENGQAQLSIVPLSAAPWQPTNEIYITRDQILFWTPLEPDGDFVKQLTLLESQGGVAQPQQQVPPLGTGTQGSGALPLQNQQAPVQGTNTPQ